MVAGWFVCCLAGVDCCGFVSLVAGLVCATCLLFCNCEVWVLPYLIWLRFTCGCGGVLAC